MRETKQSQARVLDHEDASASPSAKRAPWLEPEPDRIPQGARLIWDEAEGRLIVRMPKARWSS
jgi:hypothetical protein